MKGNCQALDAALLAQNWIAVGEMRYQLGVIHGKLKNSKKSLEYLTQFHQYCVKAKDIVRFFINLRNRIQLI